MDEKERYQKAEAFATEKQVPPKKQLLLQKKRLMLRK